MPDRPPAPPPDAVIIIFGAAVWPDGQPSPTLRHRVEAAISFAAGFARPLFIPTGAKGRFGDAEATVMARLLREAGFPAESIREELTGTDTLSSVRAAARLVPGAAPVYACTSAYHLPRCVLLLRLAGIKARACPPPPVPAATSLWRRCYWRLREAPALPYDALLMLALRRKQGEGLRPSTPPRGDAPSRCFLLTARPGPAIDTGRGGMERGGIDPRCRGTIRMNAGLEPAGAVAFDLPPDPVAQAEKIAPLLRAEAAKIEALGQLTPSVVEALHESGLYRVLLPRVYNGYDAGLATFVQVMEILAAADASTAWCLGQAVGCSLASAYVVPGVARAIWGDDRRGVLAWGFQIEGRAKVVPGGYRVTGQWGYGSGGHHASWIGAHCHVELPDGSLLKDAGGAVIERSMLLRQDQIPWERNWDVIGLRGTGSDSYRLADVFVPEAYSVRRDVDEERRLDEPFFRFTTTSAYSCGFSGVAMGIARSMLDELRALAQTKKPSHTARTLRDNPVMHHLVAENEAKLRSARAFVLETIRDGEDCIRRTGVLDKEHKVLMRLATTSAIARAKEVAEFAYHEAGASAIFARSVFDRKIRDIHAAAQQVQARTGHIEVCGQYFLGYEPVARHI